MKYLEELIKKYPKRKSDNEKASFAEFVIKEAKEAGYEANIEILDKKHKNIVIGNYRNATTIFTAHYDTPYKAFIPNLIIPKNKGIYFLYQFGCPVIISLLCLLIAFFISKLMRLHIKETAILYLAIYLLMYYILFRLFSNKNNANDNSSGVATVLTVMRNARNQNVAFILFDNEEKGKKGSKALFKHNREIFEDKLIINFDCVGCGDSILLISSEKASNDLIYNKILNSFKEDGKFEVVHCSATNTENNSDNKSFPCSIGVLACKKGKRIKYYVNRIHTSRDTLVCDENIEFLARSSCDYIKNQES